MLFLYRKQEENSEKKRLEHSQSASGHHAHTDGEEKPEKDSIEKRAVSHT